MRYGRKYDQAYARDGEFIGTAPEEGKIRSFEEAFEADMYLCLWYSMLYVAVEGWPTAREKNEKLKVCFDPITRIFSRLRDATLHPSDGVTIACSRSLLKEKNRTIGQCAPDRCLS